MTMSTSSETSPPAKGNEVRIPAAIQVHLSFCNSGGEALDNEVYAGWTRDVSGTGLSITMHVSAKLAASLDENRDGLMAEIDLKMGSRTVRVKANCMWVKLSGDGPLRSCLVGVEYVGADPDLAASIHALARRVHHQPVVIRTVAAVVIVAVVLGGLIIWSSQGASRVAIAAAEKKLAEANGMKQDIVLELETTMKEAQELFHSAGASADDLKVKQAKIEILTANFEEMREQVGELSIALANARFEPPEAMQSNAEWHFDRAHDFSEEENLPAALIEYERTILLAPDLAEAHLEVALINDLYGRNQRAIKSYRRYLKLRPSAEDAFEIRQKINMLKHELISPAELERIEPESDTRQDDMPLPKQE